ncbi:MAG: immunoglobulin domain-containing protein [Verrucomicrobiota bacterium]
MTNHVETFALQPNGKIIVALGGGYDLSGVFQPGALLRLYPDGRPDPDFAVITNLNTVEAIAIQEDGNVLVAGTFTNINGVVRQRIARVFGGERPGLPEIIFPPVGRTASVGQSVSFAAQVASNPAPGYQWLLNDDPIAGATNRTLVLASVQMTDAGRYSLMVSNRYGNTVSAAALLQVHGASPPAILTPPRAKPSWKEPTSPSVSTPPTRLL